MRDIFDRLDVFADEAPDGLFRSPGRLALAPPLTAALGLAFVMAAATLGLSTPIVTLAAAGGFALCAVAPMALLQAYVGRPLRLALAHLRAARDAAAPPLAAPAPGVIADLVAVARDIQAGRANTSERRAGLALCEQFVAAGNEAILALRLQCEALAETTARSESQWRHCAQRQFAEIAEALVAFKAAALSRAPDSSLLRIEQMLVYLAQTLERREMRGDGGDRIEGALTEIMRLIGREAQASRDAAGADDKAAQVRQQQRLETLEAHVFTRLAEVADAQSQAVSRGLGDVVERLREQGRAQAGRLDEIEARLMGEIGAAGRDNQSAALAVLAKCTDKLRNALDRFDVLSAAAAATASGQADDVRVAVRALEGEVATLGDRLAQGVAATDFLALREDFAAQGQTFDVLRADVAGVAPRFEAACEGLARRLGERFDTLDAKSPQPATRDLAAAQARCESLARQIAVSAAALAALAERESRDFERLRAAVASVTRGEGAVQAAYARDAKTPPVTIERL